MCRKISWKPIYFFSYVVKSRISHNPFGLENFAFEFYVKTEIFQNTRKHCSRMRTARSSPYRGDLPDRPPPDRDPLWTETPTEIPLNRDAPRQIPPGQRPLGQRPPAWTETPLDRDPPVNRITDRYKNITLPQLRLRAVINLKR